MWKHPPGDEIYRKGNISVFEVDGKKNKVKERCATPPDLPPEGPQNKSPIPNKMEICLCEISQLCFLLALIYYSV